MKSRFSLALCVFFFSFSALFADSSTRTVKIPYFDDDALYEKHGNDNTSSYCSEFIEILNRYTDYKFEYVPLSRKGVIDALRMGEIDMIPFFGREADLANEFLHSDMPTAIGATVFASNRMVDMDSLRIGILKHAPATLTEKVFQYVKNQGIAASYFYYDTSESLISDLYNGKIDVFTTVDFSIPPDFFVLASIENTFFSLATTKANRSLFETLNQSLSSIFLLNPYFLSTLRMRYIPSSRYSINKLTPKEQSFINTNKNLKIAVIASQPPYCSLIDGEYRGIIIDQIEEIVRYLGLEVSYIESETYREAMEKTKRGETDAIFAVTDMLILSDLEAIKPTSPLLSQKFVCVCNDEESVREHGVFIQIKGMQYSKEFLGARFKIAETVDVDTESEVFDLIEKNKNYFTLMPSLEADYYLRMHLFTNVTVLNEEGYSVALSLGLSRLRETELVGALDKAIYMLTTSQFEQFMERNMTPVPTLAAFIKKHLLLFSILTAVFVLVLATAIFLFVIIETKRRKDKQIQHAMNLANRDSMTGLFNHIAFEKKVAGMLSHQEENEIGVFVMIDIDDFKKVNDTLGHAKGDYVIVSVANLLISTFRGGDLKGRMGGDEFAVFMRNVADLEAVKRKMQMLQSSIKTYFEESELEIKVTCSIGISWCKGTQEEGAFARIYKAADEGLYQVKKSGKNAFSIVKLAE